MKLAALALSLFLCACAVDPTYTEPNWPKDMQTYRHTVSNDEMHAHCDKWAHWWETARSCSEWNIPAKTCDEWLTEDTSAEDREHEDGHCAGHTRHKGESTAGPNWPLILFLLL